MMLQQVKAVVAETAHSSKIFSALAVCDGKENVRDRCSSLSPKRERVYRSALNSAPTQRVWGANEQGGSSSEFALARKGNH